MPPLSPVARACHTRPDATRFWWGRSRQKHQAIASTSQARDADLKSLCCSDVEGSVGRAGRGAAVSSSKCSTGLYRPLSLSLLQMVRTLILRTCSQSIELTDHPGQLNSSTLFLRPTMTPTPKPTRLRLRKTPTPPPRSPKLTPKKQDQNGENSTSSC